MATDDAQKNEYLLNNENELTRLALQHHVIKDAMGGQLVLAPIDLQSVPLRILDCCTADGLWIRDLQSTIPSPLSSEHVFVGTDIEKSYFPTDPPKNTTYHVQDATKPWPSEWNNSFDLVHQRLALVCSGGVENTRATVSNYVQMVKPGGWIQLVDFPSWTADEDGPGWKDFTTCLSDMIESIGSSQQHIERAKGWLEELGLVNVEEKVLLAKYGTRDDKALEEIGKRAAMLTAAGILGVTTGFPQELLSLPKERVPKIKADLEKELNSNPSNCHWHYHVVWGKKPE